MSLALIQESAKEVRRLAIAGSSLAVGDFRLKKLIPPLEQAGAKVPVFAQVAKAIGDVVNGKEADSAANLLNLSTLLNAILYTQGQTNADGELRELEVFPSNSVSTRTSARVLKPIVHALTSTGGGRFETVKSAVERNAFNDLRLIDPAIQALGDVYPELADLVAEKILPGFGPGIVPLLKSGLDLKGKKQDARRLQIMQQLDPAGTLPLCKTALEDGSVEVKATAIACLGKHEDCLPLVLEQANAKNKQLRAAALEALAEHDRPEVTKLFTELVKGKALDILAGPFRKLENKQVLKSLLGEGKQSFDALLKGDEDQFVRYWEVLTVLGGRKDGEIEEFLLECFSQPDKFAKVKSPKKSIVTHSDLTVRLVELLYEIGTPKTLEAVLAKRDVLPLSAFHQVLQSALRTWAPDKVFTEFSPLLEQRKGAGKEKSELLERVFYASSHGRGAALLNRYVPEDDETEDALTITLDARWLDAAIKADRPESVCSLARPGHKGVVTYLLKLVEGKNKLRLGLVIEALARCQYPKLTDLYLELVAKATKGSKRWDYDLQQLIETARYLPPTDLPRLEEFAGKLDQNYQDHFLEAIAPLRPTTQPN
ncbi:MAG TPA: HEAT repeat domain-containing protein [Verrucomicrobiota bacterium]|nr:HEAT repeat domain-containing protein [Verrucomicrobiota bacterium]